MKVFPTEQEIELAADLLVNKYQISAKFLSELFGKKQRDQANSIFKSLGKKKLTQFDIARLLIQRKGPELFSGSENSIRKLRLKLLQNVSDEKVKLLFNKYKNDSKIVSPSYMRRPLAEMKWYAGKQWARDFVSTLEFPSIFAGVVPQTHVPTIQDVPPLSKPPNLAEFQEQLKDKMLKVLNQEGIRTRCVVTLPTGGGKTRIAVEAFIDWMQPRFLNGEYLIWIAQNEELCEQVIACLSQMWGSQEFVSPLRIYRFFGGRALNADDLNGGVVVASIQQLYNRIKSNEEELKIIFQDTGAMIIDEAHRAVSQMYDYMLNVAEQICGPELFPICGLTATPGRTGLSGIQETIKLVGRFEAYLIKPELDLESNQRPLQYFRDHEFLARANHIIYRSGREYTLTDDELNQLNQENDLPSTFLKRLADDKQRNLRLIEKLLQIPKDTPTLVYACTVEHAYFLSVILTAQGRKSGVVSANTPMTLRRSLMRDFKEQKIEFLCNYGVLTTGFDAPKTQYIVICRPTKSEVLYEQMIGRGLRGPKFGGTKECTIIDFADNIHYHGAPLAYARFEDFWSNEQTKTK